VERCDGVSEWSGWRASEYTDDRLGRLLRMCREGPRQSGDHELPPSHSSTSPQDFDGASILPQPIQIKQIQSQEPTTLSYGCGRSPEGEGYLK